MYNRQQYGSARQVPLRPHERDRKRSRDDRDRGGGRPTTMTVKTNYFRLTATNDVDKGEWIQYGVKIIDAIRRKKKGPDGNYLEPWQFEVVPYLLKRQNETGEPIEKEKTVNLDKGTTPLSRRILIKLQKNLLDEKPPRYFVVRNISWRFSPIFRSNDVFGPSAIRLMATIKHSLPEDCSQNSLPCQKSKNLTQNHLLVEYMGP